MKKIIKFLFLTLIFFMSTNVDALESCSTSELKRLRELANNVEFTYDYEIMAENKENEIVDLDYNIQVLNTNSDLKIKYKRSYSNDLITLDSNNTSISGFSENEMITFYIYSYTANLCTDRLLKKVSINLPIYNAYYYHHKEKCNEYLDFSYCKEFMDIKDLSYEEIDELFEEYKKDEKINNITKQVKNIEWYWYLLGGVFLTIVSGIIIIKVIKKKDDI